MQKPLVLRFPGKTVEPPGVDRGSPYLRRAVYMASSIAHKRDPELEKYYVKKNKEVTIANAGHILHRVYAVWRRGT